MSSLTSKFYKPPPTAAAPSSTGTVAGGSKEQETQKPEGMREHPVLCVQWNLSTTDTLIILQLWRKSVFLHSYKIKSGSDLGMKLANWYMLHMYRYSVSQNV